MNPFEQYTIIIGILAIAFEGVSRLRSFLHKFLH